MSKATTFRPPPCGRGETGGRLNLLLPGNTHIVPYLVADYSQSDRESICFQHKAVLILRVISGKARGMRLKAPKGLSTRPTTDRVKESVFGVLAPHTPLVDKVLDLYAGSGALGIEALSRGASSAVFIEKSNGKCGVIRENLQKTGFIDSARVISADCLGALERLDRSGESFELIVSDPPYDRGLAQKTVAAVANASVLSRDGVLVIEHSATEPLPDAIGGIVRYRTQQYGRVLVSFYRWRVGEVENQ